MSRSIAIIGAGAVGTNAAIFLAKMGFQVKLFDSQPDILVGSPLVSFINHGDGFEYYKKGHQITGKFCIDGSMVKGLLYPLDRFRTPVVSEENPIRFLVSKASFKKKTTPLDEFYNNAETMKQHFAAQYRCVKKIRHWSDQEAERVFLRTPETFYKILKTEDFKDLTNVAGGCSGSSFGINMPHYFAYLKAALRQVGVTINANSNIECIEKMGQHYVVYTGGNAFKVDLVLVTANQGIPVLALKRKNFELVRKVCGTYYLNSMTFLELPETSNGKLIKALTHINFTLQGNDGCMFACIVPPTASSKGTAVIYFPSMLGSQSESFIYRYKGLMERAKLKTISWQKYINKGADNEDESVQRTYEQACIFYPFLKSYAKIKSTKYRAVFNIDSKDSEMGTDRRVREISNTPMLVSEDGRVSMWTAPKWTNAELVALIATDYVCRQVGTECIPKMEKGGFGPTQLDISSFSTDFNFHGLQLDMADVNRYILYQGLPDPIGQP